MMAVQSGRQRTGLPEQLRWPVVSKAASAPDGIDPGRARWVKKAAYRIVPTTTGVVTTSSPSSWADQSTGQWV